MEKLIKLRSLMRERGMDAYIISGADGHQSEYVNEHWRTRAWLTGFTGSSGTVAVTDSEAGLWTDGRYFIQAEKQLAGSGVCLYKMEVEGVPEFRAWLADKIPENGRLGFDGGTFSVSEFDRIKESLEDKQINYSHNMDLINEIWKDRPARPASGAFAHELRFAGQTSREKLQKVRERMLKEKADGYLVGALDEIAWLLNIRGRDIPQTPVISAYLYITESSAHLFANPLQFDAVLSAGLAEQGFTLHEYDEITGFLRKINPESRLLYNPEKTNVRLSEAIPKSCTVKKDEKANIIGALKAVKNDIEIQNIRNAHVREGVIMVRLLKWLDEKRNGPLFESDIHDFLTRQREAHPEYIEPSFETISAYGENAASMHYSPAGRGAEIKEEGFLLVDTGAQYLDGTTDITRTVVMGEINAEMKRDFTLVLKGHMNLASAVFLSGVTGTHLDALARAPLWANGLNYRSGTGHGIGYCLGVHESPPFISMRENKVKLEPGMLLTNEPGVYKEKKYGIRTENTMLVKELFKNEDGSFLGFEILSFCPIDVRALDKNLLSENEIEFLNAYHQKVREALSPHLNDEETAWLEKSAPRFL